MMPHYQYQCDKCQCTKTLIMTVKEFLKFKQKNQPCHNCAEGNFQQLVKPSHSKVFRDKHTMIEEARAEAKKVIEKINKGDERTIIDIYGDRPNPLKNKGDI